MQPLSNHAKTPHSELKEDESGQYKMGLRSYGVASRARTQTPLKRMRTYTPGVNYTMWKWNNKISTPWKTKPTWRRTLVKSHRDAQCAIIRTLQLEIWKSTWWGCTQQRSRSSATSVRNYACTGSGVLQCHMKTHTLERPFKCSQCDGTFKWKIDLTRHFSV